jgi:maltose O-acetyltransferase
LWALIAIRCRILLPVKLRVRGSHLRRLPAFASRDRFGRWLLDTIRRDPKLSDLVERGLKIGRDVSVGRDVFLAELCPWLLTIGDDATIGMHVTIFTWDNSTKRRIGYTSVAPVVIGDGAYIGAFSIILPGVTIGKRAVVGAGSVVRSDIPAGVVAAGAPARVLGPAEDFDIKNRARLSSVYESVWAVEGVGGAVPKELRERMQADLAGGKIGFIP